MLIEVKIVKESKNGIVERIISENFNIYEKLNINEVIETEDDEGNVEDCIVLDVKKSFGYFGDTLLIKIETIDLAITKSLKNNDYHKKEKDNDEA